jgi:serine/threonine-protein kinase
MVDPISLQPRTQDAIGQATMAARSRPGLPLDLLDDIARRLQFVCVIIFATSAANLFISNLTGIEVNRSVRIVLLATMWLVAGAVFVVARRRLLSAEWLLRIGMAFEVFTAAWLSVSSVELSWFTAERVTILWSSVAVWVLIYPVIVPSRPKTTLVTSILAAVTEPAAVFVFVAAGVGQLPSAETFIRHLWPHVVAVALAVAISGVIYRLGEKLSHARQMGSYQLETKLGQGGMGEVWKGTHRMLARPAAVKLISPDRLGADAVAAEKALRRFEREAQATSQLRSPHTIGIYDFGLSRDGTFYYVMELLDGLDLQSLVDDHGTQPEERVVHILRHACHSLYEAHLAGLIHRDIKPGNLFLCRYGVDLDFVKVLDFGIVKQQEVAGPAGAQLTAVDMIAGTPAFLPPEMGLAEQSVDGRADLYSLGCVAYWLLTGRLVFEGMNAMATIVSHIHDAPEPISRRTEQPVHADLEAIIMRCLAKKPDDRPQDALELYRLLGELDIAGKWTDERAAEWWEKNRPKTA